MSFDHAWQALWCARYRTNEYSVELSEPGRNSVHDHHVKDEDAEVVPTMTEQGLVKLFVATDNSLLKTRVLSSRCASQNLVTHSCASCMVNPVLTHNFTKRETDDIFIEMGILAHSRCMYTVAFSNFAQVAIAMRKSPGCVRTIHANSGECRMLATRHRRKSSRSSYPC